MAYTIEAISARHPMRSRHSFSTILRESSVLRPAKEPPMPAHPALAAGRVAVITGAASGIGLAAARRFASMGMRVCMADLSDQALTPAASDVAATSPEGHAAV